MCPTDFKLPEPEDDVDRKLLADVQDPGWHVVLIPGDDTTPGWAFTIGLYANYDHPEVVVFGLPRQVAHAVLNAVGRQVKDGARIELDTPYPDILGEVNATFRTVCVGWYMPFLGYANWFHRSTDYPVLQCFWPDKEERYPWEPGFNPDWLDAQPLLHHEDPVQARAQALLDSMEAHEQTQAPARPAKTYAIPGAQIKPLAQGYGACFATDLIMVDGQKVGFMYREDPDNDVDSGWRFMAGPESDEYMQDVENIGLYDVNTVANYDPEIIPLLEAPSGTAFERSGPDRALVEVDFVPSDG